MYRPKTLHQKLLFYLLVPVVVLLAVMNLFGMSLATRNLFDQWQETVTLWLQRGAHTVDMQLRESLRWIDVLRAGLGETFSEGLQDWILSQARRQEGVSGIQVRWLNKARRDNDSSAPAAANPFAANGAARLGVLHWVESSARDAATFEAYLLNAGGQKVGLLRVSVRYEHLLKGLSSSAWWPKLKTCLVDSRGRILAGNFPPARKRLGDNGNRLELKVWRQLAQENFGTIIGEEDETEEVGGFQRLREAPWSLVVIAPGDEVLAPILRFRRLYLIGSMLFLVVIVVLVRLVTGKMVTDIERVSDAAQSVARGRFDINLPVKGRDEVAQLVESFNTMTAQLQERIRLKEALDLAREVQQNLLPREAPRLPGLDIAGRSIYCDQTGGDYFDFLQFAELGAHRLAVAVGDVVGHGISAALMMTTVRAFLRSRITQPGNLSRIMAHVNRLFCLDTADSGNFMTLFVMVVDTDRKELQWVRAGHDPAVVYDPGSDRFTQLKGSGIALGFDETASFHEYRFTRWPRGGIIVIGTDGIWETENDRSEAFGKERLNQIIRHNSHLPAADLAQAIMDSLSAFRGSVPQHDDVTLVVMKAL